MSAARLLVPGPWRAHNNHASATIRIFICPSHRRSSTRITTQISRSRQDTGALHPWACTEESLPTLYAVSILSFMKAASVADLHDLLGDTFTYGEARRTGLSDRRLYVPRDTGQVIALGGGVYRWADAPPADDDLVETAERVPGHPAAAPAPRSGRPAACTSSTPAPFGLYTAERSIIDAIRLRHREGSDLAWQALRRWLNQLGASPGRHTQLAQRFPYAEPALRRALAVLL